MHLVSPTIIALHWFVRKSSQSGSIVACRIYFGTEAEAAAGVAVPAEDAVAAEGAAAAGDPMAFGIEQR